MGAAVAVAVVACGGSDAGCGAKDEDPAGKAGAAEDPAGPNQPGPAPLPPAEPLPLGKPDLDGYAYNRGPARPPFVRAVEAERSSQWATVAAASREALAIDPGHLEAAWTLATSLARQGLHDQVLAPLSVAVAGDWLRWGDRSLEDPALQGFLRSAHGPRYRDLAAIYEERFRQALASGLLVVGRRGPPWYPRRKGAVVINHRSEIYAYDLEAARYVRVSRTDGALVGYLRAPVGASLAYVSYRRLVVPADGAPYLGEVRVGMVDLDRGRMGEHEVVFTDVAALHLAYEAGADGDAPVPVARVQAARPGGGGQAGNETGNGAGGQAGNPAGNQAGSEVGSMRAYLLDFDSGEARQLDDGGEEPGSRTGSSAATGNTGPGDGAPGSTLVVTARGVQIHRIPVDGIAADWDDAGTAGAFRLQRTRRTVTLAAGELANGHSMVWSPTQARLAFATAAPHDDPCAADAAADAATDATTGRVRLYVVEAATGKLRQVAEAPANRVGAFAPMWLDDARLAFADASGSNGTGAVVLADVVTGEEVARLEGSGGVGTDRLPGRLPWAPACPISTHGNAEQPVPNAHTGTDDTPADEPQDDLEDDLGAPGQPPPPGGAGAKPKPAP